MLKNLFLALPILSITVNSVSAEVRHAGAHVHGLNQVQIIQEGSMVQVLYQMPVDQLHSHGKYVDEKHSDKDHDHDHGHKHAESEVHHQESEKEQKELEYLEQLAEFGALFRFEENASGCELSEFDSSLHSVTTGGENAHSGHKDARLVYTFECSKANSGLVIRFTAFDTYPVLESIDLEALVANQAFSKRITKDTNRVEF